MTKSITGILLITSVILAGPLQAAEISSDKEKLSYALGAYFSQGVTQQDIDIDVPAFMQAVEDILTQSELKLSEEEMQQVLAAYQKQVTEERSASAENNKAKGEEFLAENKDKEGVKTLPSGLQYKVLEKGDGPKPSVDDNVKVHYHGTLIDGTVFDSSYQRGEPISLALNQVIKGWQEAVPLMNVGSKYKIFVPADLAYGERGAGGKIGPNETLIFDIELLGIN